MNQIMKPISDTEIPKDMVKRLNDETTVKLAEALAAEMDTSLIEVSYYLEQVSLSYILPSFGIDYDVNAFSLCYYCENRLILCRNVI
jgi:hypothetical protein